EIVTGLPVCLAAASVFTLYDARLALDDALVLGISQSGRAGDACDVVKVNRDAGRLTACITNHPGSLLGQAAEYVISCEAGEEKSLPATKTYTTSLAAVAAFAARFAEEGSLSAALREVPAAMAAAVATEPEIEARVARYRYMEECLIL